LGRRLEEKPARLHPEDRLRRYINGRSLDGYVKDNVYCNAYCTVIDREHLLT